MTGRQQKLTRFHKERAEQVRRAVAANVRTSDSDLLEDAMQAAWLTLVRRTDISLDDQGASWLTTVAIREGWRLARVKREVPSGSFRGTDVDELEHPEPPSLHGDPEERTLARATHEQRIHAFMRLSAHERRALWLKAHGLSYAEIAEVAQVSLSAVNRHLSNGRAKLRRSPHFLG